MTSTGGGARFPCGPQRLRSGGPHDRMAFDESMSPSFPSLTWNGSRNSRCHCCGGLQVITRGRQHGNGRRRPHSAAACVCAASVKRSAAVRQRRGAVSVGPPTPPSSSTPLHAPVWASLHPPPSTKIAPPAGNPPSFSVPHVPPWAADSPRRPSGAPRGRRGFQLGGGKAGQGITASDASAGATSRELRIQIYRAANAPCESLWPHVDTFHSTMEPCMQGNDLRSNSTQLSKGCPSHL